MGSSRHKSRAGATVGLLSGLSIVSATSTRAATFSVDPAASSIAVSGTALGAPIQQQGPGSLTTTYQGPLLVNLSSSTISFPGGSAVAANNSGNWQPMPGGNAGSAPANYGGQVNLGIFGTAHAAVRGTVFDGNTSSPFALSGNNSATFSSALDFHATTGSIDYNSVLAVGTSPVSSDPATNASPNNATLNIASGAPGHATATISLPVQFTITSDLGGVGQGVFNFLGSMTARATTITGDANFDGLVNVNDFTVLASNFGQTGKGWLSGDFNFDGRVNVNDFALLASNFGLSASGINLTPGDWSALASAVPEPNSMILLPGLAAVRRRNRRR